MCKEIKVVICKNVSEKVMFFTYLKEHCIVLGKKFLSEEKVRPNLLRLNEPNNQTLVV